jgi:aquaporin Z
MVRARLGALRTPRPLLASEFIGTFLLVAVGVSLVILDFGVGSAVPAILPDPAVRRAITGFLFGSVGALIAVSRVGKLSGAHINPVVSGAFWLTGTLPGRHAAEYVAAQLAGGALAALPLLAWGRVGASVAYGATLPGPGHGGLAAMAGEAVTTFALVAGLFTFLGRPRLRRFTPLLFPFLYAFMVWVEAPLSGTSTNPARTLGPAIAADVWSGWWVYLVGPAAGLLAAVAAHRWRLLGRLEVEVAKLYHFEHDVFGFFRREVSAADGHGGSEHPE